MELKNKFASVKSVIEQKLFNKRFPLIISWTLSNRCNRKCRYCNLPNIKCQELTTEEVLKTIDELKDNGTHRIGFTGGEPLLRKDIGKIISYCKSKGIFVGVVSNGSLVKERIRQLKDLDLLHLSLDGREKINDKQRYIGSYKGVIEAICAAKEQGIRTWITYVITKENTDKEDYMHVLDLAKDFGLKIFFQPVVTYKNCGEYSESLSPKISDFREMIRCLISEKKRNREIGNSLEGLKQLYHWPNLKNLSVRCHAGRLMAHIYPNGDMYPCFNLIYHKTKNVKQGVKNVFDSMDRYEVNKCDGCWTYATIEFNLLLSLNPSAIMNTSALLR